MLFCVSYYCVFILLTLIIHFSFQFATVEVVRMTLQKFIKQSFNKAGGWVADLVAIALCLACFIGSFPYIAQVLTMRTFSLFKNLTFFITIT